MAAGSLQGRACHRARQDPGDRSFFPTIAWSSPAARNLGYRPHSYSNDENLMVDRARPPAARRGLRRATLLRHIPSDYRWRWYQKQRGRATQSRPAMGRRRLQPGQRGRAEVLHRQRFYVVDNPQEAGRRQMAGPLFQPLRRNGQPRAPVLGGRRARRCRRAGGERRGPGMTSRADGRWNRPSGPPRPRAQPEEGRGGQRLGRQRHPGRANGQLGRPAKKKAAKKRRQRKSRRRRSAKKKAAEKEKGPVPLRVAARGARVRTRSRA